MIKVDAAIEHPLTDGTTPGLQYTDDTIILLRADIESVQRLKLALDSFSACTGLVINFGKSMTTPMHIPLTTYSPSCKFYNAERGNSPKPTWGSPSPMSSYRSRPSPRSSPRWTGTSPAGKLSS